MKQLSITVNLIAIICCTIAAVMNFYAGNILLVILMCGLIGVNSALIFFNITR